EPPACDLSRHSCWSISSRGFRRAGIDARRPLTSRSRWRRWRWLPAFGQDLGDSNQGELLAMPPLASRILAPALFEGNDLGAANVIQDLGGDRCTCHAGGAKVRRVATDHQNFCELHDGTGL